MDSLIESNVEGKQSPDENKKESTPIKQTQEGMNVNDISHVIPDPAATTVDETRTTCSTNELNSLFQLLSDMKNMQISQKEDMKNMKEELKQEIKEDMKNIKEEIKMVQVSLNKTEKKIDDIDKKLEGKIEVLRQENEERKNDIKQLEENQMIAGIDRKHLYSRLDKVQDSIRQFQEKMDQSDDRAEKLDKKIDTELSKTNFELLTLNEKIETNNECVENIQREQDKKFKQFESSMKDKFENVESGVNQRLENLADQINVSFNSTMFTSNAPVAISPESLPKFNGNNSMNPIIFLKNLKSCVENIPSESRKLQIVRASLRDSALIWWDMYSDEISTFVEFEKKFINQYWGQTQQMRIRQDLLFGQFRVGGYDSREMYLIKKYSVIKHLTPPIAEVDIVTQLTRHFDSDVIHAVALRGVETVEQLIDLVRKLDDADNQERRNNIQMPRRDYYSHNTNINTNYSRNREHQKNEYHDQTYNKNNQRFRDRPYTSQYPRYQPYQPRKDISEPVINETNRQSDQNKYNHQNSYQSSANRDQNIRMTPERDRPIPLNNTGTIPKDTRQEANVIPTTITKKSQIDDERDREKEKRQIQDEARSLDFIQDHINRSWR